MDFSLNHFYGDLKSTIKSYPGGARALGQVIGSNPKTFTNKCNPNNKEHILTLSEVLAIIKETKDARILQSISKIFGVVCIKKHENAPLSDMSILNAWATWDIENSDVSRAFLAAFNDNKLTTAEHDEICNQMYEAFEKELYLFQLLDIHLRGEISCPLITQLHQQNRFPDYQKAIVETIPVDSEVFDGIVKNLKTTKGSFQNKIDPDNNEMQLNLRDLIQIIKFTEDLSILVSIANDIGYVAVKVMQNFTPEENDALLELWSESASERAWTVQHIQRVIERKSLTEQDMARICKTMFDDFERGFELLKRLEDFRVD